MQMPTQMQCRPLGAQQQQQRTIHFPSFPPPPPPSSRRRRRHGWHPPVLIIIAAHSWTLDRILCIDATTEIPPPPCTYPRTNCLFTISMLDSYTPRTRGPLFCVLTFVLAQRERLVSSLAVAGRLYPGMSMLYTAQ